MKLWKVRVSSDIRKVPERKATFEGAYDEAITVARRRARKYAGTAELYMPPRPDGQRLLRATIDRDGTERWLRAF